MKKILATVIGLALVVSITGCAWLNLGGGGGGTTGPISVTDYFLVGAGNPVGLMAPTNSPVVIAEINVKLADIEGVPEIIGNLIGDLQTYIVFGAEKGVPVPPTPTPAPTGVVEAAAMSITTASPITIGDFYSIEAGSAVDVSAPAATPAIVLGVAIDLSQIEGIPDNIGDGINGLAKPYIILGGVRKTPEDGTGKK